MAENLISADLSIYLIAKMEELSHLAVVKAMRFEIKTLVRDEIKRQLAESLTVAELLKVVIAEKSNVTT